MSAPANRTSSGRFVAGVSGNPTGKPKSAGEFEQLARLKAPAAIERLMEIARGRGLPAVRAAEIILDRAYGKPSASMHVTASRLTQMPEAFAIGAASVLEKALAEADGEQTDSDSAALPDIPEELPVLGEADSNGSPTTVPPAPEDEP